MQGLREKGLNDKHDLIDQEESSQQLSQISPFPPKNPREPHCQRDRNRIDGAAHIFIKSDGFRLAFGENVL